MINLLNIILKKTIIAATATATATATAIATATIMILSYMNLFSILKYNYYERHTLISFRPENT